MEQLSTVLLCVFIPVTAFLLLYNICVTLKFRKRRGLSKLKKEIPEEGKDEEAQILLTLLENKDGPVLRNDQQYIADQTASNKSQEPNIKKSSCTKYVSAFDSPKGNKNLGNTCFFNSILQVLCVTKSFQDVLSCLKELAPNFDSLNLIKSALDLLEKKKVSHIRELRGLLKAVNNINNHFGRGTQEDSYEFFNTLLGGIFDELRNANIDNGENGIRLKNMFTGLFVTIYVYDSCNDVEVQIQEFTALSIPVVEQPEQQSDRLPHEGLRTISSEEPRNDLEKGLTALTHVEDYPESMLSCRICKKDGSGRAYKRMLVFQPPPVLVIHINRFGVNDSNCFAKNGSRVHYPRRFSMANFCSVANTKLTSENLIYELYALIVHSGTLKRGHYFAYVNTTRMHDVEKWQEHLERSPENVEALKNKIQDSLREHNRWHDKSSNQTMYKDIDNWYHVSDDHVRSANIDEVINHADAYILFYEVQ